MNYRIAILEQLRAQPYFEKRDVRELAEPFGIKASTVDAYISRSLRAKEIIALRRELYVTAAFYDKHRGDSSYRFYVANILRKPSYVSSWAALQYYGLATEVIHTISSVSSKPTREYRTKLGNFAYQSIKPDLFSGYLMEKQTFSFFIATPAKALFDLLYFRLRRIRKVSVSTIDRMIDDLRIDFDEMSSPEKDRFYGLFREQYSHE